MSPPCREKRTHSSDGLVPRKNSNHIAYDHERACKYVNDDWMGPIPHFPDKTFECAF